MALGDKIRQGVLWGLASLVCAGFSFWVSDSVEERGREEVRSIFRSQVDHFERELKERLLLQNGLLYAARTFYETNETLTPENWQRFSRLLNAPVRYPALTQLAVVDHLPEAHLTSYRAILAREYPDVTITVNRSQGPYQIVRQLAVLGYYKERGSRWHVGADLGEVPEQRAGAERARDQGDSLSVPLPSRGGETWVDLASFLPMYDQKRPLASLQSRREHLRGWIAATFDTSLMLNNLLRSSGVSRSLEIEFYAGAEPTREAKLTDLMDISGGPTDALYSEQRLLTVGEQNWSLIAYSTPGFEAAHRVQTPYAILSITLLITLGLTLALFLLIQGKRRAVEAARASAAEGRRREAEHRGIITTTTEGYWQLDADGLIIDVNPALGDLMDRKPEKLLGTSPYFFVAESCHHILRDCLENLTEDSHQRCELDFYCHNGDIRHVRVNLSLVPRAPGQGRLSFALIDDRTEERIAQRRLEDTLAQLHKLSMVVEQSPINMFITDTNGNIEYVNRKFVEQTGYSSEEIMGQNPRILKSGKMAPDTYTDLWQTIRAGKPWHGELLNRRKDGELFWERAFITPLRDEEDDDAEVSHFVAVNEDISETKAAEQRLHHRVRLEKLVATISAAFLDAPFEKTSDRLRVTLRTLTEFAGGDNGFIYLGAPEDGDSLLLDMNWRDPEVDPPAMPDTPDRFCGWAMEGFTAFQPLLLTSPDDVPASAETERDEITKLKMQSLMILPLRAGRKLIGLLGLSSTQNALKVAEEDSSQLRVIGEIFASAIERSESDAALRESENRKSAVLMASLDAIITINSKDRIIDFNPAAEAIFGYSSEQATGQLLAELIIPEDQREVHRVALARYAASNKTNNKTSNIIGKRRETLAVNANLEEFPVEVTVTQISADQPFFTAFIRDISERRRAEESMRLAATVYEAAAEGILITEKDGRIKAVNPAFTRVTGYSASEVIGCHLEDFASGQQGGEFFDNLKASVRTAGNWEGEIWNRRKSGEVYPEWVAITAIRNSKNEIVEYVIVLTDLTQRDQGQERTWRRANFDALTGLPNRPLLIDRLTQAIGAAFRNHSRFAVLFVDLDGFKEVNDTHGHAAGDGVLQEMARRLRESVRAVDTVARFAGDEFVLVLLEIEDINHAQSVGNKILESLNAPMKYGDIELGIKASIGAAIYPDHGVTPESLLEVADTAMYGVKKSTKNGVRVAAAAALMEGPKGT